MIGHLRKNFPANVTSETVKKFAIAPNNESYVINALQFIGVITEDGKRTKKGHDVFVMGDDAFPKAFADLIRGAYNDLFDVRGEDAWTLSRKDLTAYFRTTDKTSEVIGDRQASVFQTFRDLAGHDNVNGGSDGNVGGKTSSKLRQAKSKVTPQKKAAEPAVTSSGAAEDTKDGRKNMALTVRIEINLPANGTQEVYDNIFKSIRANLINE